MCGFPKALIRSEFLPDHVVKATEDLFNKYYPIEKDYSIDKQEKEKHMKAWFE